ncbi:hypothetical protein BGZ76_002800 [Entomortierella beljakovae]|nr:hypothetical protein BGZ76_002800 [Entomortierella beljakovae]
MNRQECPWDETETFAANQKEQQEHLQEHGDVNSTGENNGTVITEVSGDSDEEATSTLIRKVPFRGFTPQSAHSFNLLNAMLRHSPFNKANGPSVPKRWGVVVDSLKVLGASNVDIGESNPYDNVIARTCQLAWSSFRASYYEHEKAQRLTGSMQNEHEWNNLLRRVVESEEREKGNDKKRKERNNPLAELIEQTRDDGEILVETSTTRMKRPRIGITSESESATDSPDPESLWHYHRHQKIDTNNNNNTNNTNIMEELVRFVKDQYVENRRIQQKHADEMRETMDRQFQMMDRQTRTMEAAFDRQTAALEALAVILSKK